MRTLRVAGAQIPVVNDIGENVAAIERAVAFARDAGADILLTPEGSLSGYTPDFDPAAVAEALQRVTRTAREARVGLALGTCLLESDGRRYNELRWYAPDGRCLGFHAKILTCAGADLGPGEDRHYASKPLERWRFGDAAVGGLICNDLWANPLCTPQPDPHLAQQLSAMGAEVIFHAVNGARSDDEWSRVCWQYHEANLRMRARAGRIWIVTADSCHPPALPCSSPSGVIGPDGAWLCRTEPQGERHFVATLPLAARQFPT